MKTNVFLTGLAMLSMALPTWSAEARVWMSRQGGTVEATLASLRGDQVNLTTTDGRQLTLRPGDLSLADRQHLVEFAGAERSILDGGDPGQPEKDLRLDNSMFETLPDKLVLEGESEASFDLMRTPHFLIATAGNVRPRPVAETAERLWHGMAFQHMSFRTDWGDRRALIFVVEDRDTYKALGDWYTNQLNELQAADAAMQLAATWNRVGGSNVRLTDELVADYNLHPLAKSFNVTDATRYRRPMSPFVVHSLSSYLLGSQLGGISSYGSEGYYALVTGHSYFKEISLAGKSETNQLAVEGSARDEISSRGGFEDGTSWARTLRQLVRRNRVEPSLTELMSWGPADLNPERLVLIYSFAHYMQGDAARLSSFAAMVRRIESSNQIPELIEVARLFGFETVEELQEDWIEFIRGGNFR